MSDVNLRMAMLKGCLHIAKLHPMTKHSSGEEVQSHFPVTQMEQAPWLGLVGKKHADLKTFINGPVHDVIQSRVASSVAEGAFLHDLKQLYFVLHRAQDRL